MIQRLIILGLLKKGLFSGYDIKKYLRTELGVFATIVSQSIYYPLQKMEKEGLIKRYQTRGSRQARKTTYTITPKGEKEFFNLCKQALRSTERPFIESDIALYFLPFLDKKEILPLLRLRMRFLENVKRWLTEKGKEYTSGPKNLSLLLRHHLVLARAEKGFMESMVQVLREE